MQQGNDYQSVYSHFFLRFWINDVTDLLIEHDYRKIIKFSVFQAMGISTVGKAWDYTPEVSTEVIGLWVLSLFCWILFCSNTILASIPEWSIIGKPRVLDTTKNLFDRHYDTMAINL